MGLFIGAIRRELKISVQDLCMESNISTTTYYRVIAGNDHNLNVYVRMIDCFAAYCEADRYRRMEHEFMALLRAELCVSRNLEMDTEVEKVWEKWMEWSKTI